MDIRKLQRVIVDALEDVKAQDIQVFNTEHLTSLFDRVIIASGTSNRQTRALAASVRDKVKAAGGAVKNPEGESSGEWVLVDCGDAVVHIMQPVVRAYYKLEDVWGGKSVHLKARHATDGKSSGATRLAAERRPAAAGKRLPAKAATTTARKTAPAKAAAATRKRASPAAKSGAAPAPRKRTATTTPASRTAAASAGTSSPTGAKRRPPAKKSAG